MTPDTTAAPYPTSGVIDSTGPIDRRYPWTFDVSTNQCRSTCCTLPVGFGPHAHTASGIEWPATETQPRPRKEIPSNGRIRFDY